jgi:hypothetical protein
MKHGSTSSVLQDSKAIMLPAHIILCMCDDDDIVMNMARWQQTSDVV